MENNTAKHRPFRLTSWNPPAISLSNNTPGEIHISSTNGPKNHPKIIANHPQIIPPPSKPSKPSKAHSTFHKRPNILPSFRPKTTAPDQHRPAPRQARRPLRLPQGAGDQPVAISSPCFGLENLWICGESMGIL